MKAVIVIEVNDDINLSLIHANVELYPNELTATYRGEPFHKGYLLKEVRPLPKERILPKWQTEHTNYGEEPWFSDGWNACLEEILGESNTFNTLETR